MQTKQKIETNAIKIHVLSNVKWKSVNTRVTRDKLQSKNGWMNENNAISSNDLRV